MKTRKYTKFLYEAVLNMVTSYSYGIRLYTLIPGIIYSNAHPNDTLPNDVCISVSLNACVHGRVGILSYLNRVQLLGSHVHSTAARIKFNFIVWNYIANMYNNQLKTVQLLI